MNNGHSDNHKQSASPMDALAERINADAQERTRAMVLLCNIKHRHPAGASPLLYTEALKECGVPEAIAAAAVFEDLLYTFPKLKPYAVFRAILAEYERFSGVYLGDIY